MHDEDAVPVRLEFPRRYSPGTHPELYKRNVDLDPQLVWRGNNAGEVDVQLVWKGKEDEDKNPLQVDAVPIYIQEKVHPKAVINDIRRRQEGVEDWPYDSEAPDLFADFNGIPAVEDKLKYYEHDQVGLKWSNRLILGDSLAVMASLAEKEGLRGKVQMIYLDPPYGIKFNSNWQVSTRDTGVKDGRREFESREPEVVRAFRDTWTKGVNTYLSYLRDRLRMSQDLLAETGSCFVQIGEENLHLVRNLLDEVFGDENFISTVTVQKTYGFEQVGIANVADYILWYAKRKSSLKSRRLLQEKPFELGSGNATWVLLPNGQYRGVTKSEQRGERPLPEGARFLMNPLIFARL
jgi:adenine-specific DNA-methyltransferase